MFNFYYDKRLETKYIKSFFVNTTYEELDDYDSSKDETQRRLERIDSLARADVGYNFHFVPLYFLGNDKGYKPTSVVACILNFFVNGKLEGKGTMYYKNGEKYVGEFKGNLNHGEGKYYNKSGKVIKEGKWINGAYQDPNKTVHGYTFENAKIPPEQKTFYYSNYKLISMVKNNRPDLLGTFYYNNGDIYSGVHKNLYKDTFGAYIYKNGRVQVGEYVQNKMCGYCFDYSTNNHFNLAFYDNFVKKGIFYSVSFGQVWIAMCDGDKLIKNIYKGPIKNSMFPGIPKVPISFKYFGDDLYFGELINGKMHGFGKLLLPNKDKYIGYFQNNEFCGVGAYCFSDGSVYLGQFKDSQFHGLGVMINIDKTYDVSIYENGEEVKYLV